MRTLLWTLAGGALGSAGLAFSAIAIIRGVYATCGATPAPQGVAFIACVFGFLGGIGGACAASFASEVES